jgi:uncharacterized protein with PQ loop repeat
LEEEDEDGNAWVRNTLSILGVVLVGAAGWAIAWQSGVWMPTVDDGGDLDQAVKTAVGAKVLGYFSAVCYLGYVFSLPFPVHNLLIYVFRARIPQIVKNYRDKSCEGLALLFFLLSLMGNATYGASILCHSVEKEYLSTNLPWLIGSLGTMVEDAIIFVQFRMYAPKVNTSAVE